MDLLFPLGFIPLQHMNAHTHKVSPISRDNGGCTLVLEYIRKKVFDLMIFKSPIGSKILEFKKGFWRKIFR